MEKLNVFQRLIWEWVLEDVLRPQLQERGLEHLLEVELVLQDQNESCFSVSVETPLEHTDWLVVTITVLGTPKVECERWQEVDAKSKKEEVTDLFTWQDGEFTFLS